MDRRRVTALVRFVHAQDCQRLADNNDIYIRGKPTYIARFISKSYRGGDVLMLDNLPKGVTCESIEQFVSDTLQIKQKVWKIYIIFRDYAGRRSESAEINFAYIHLHDALDTDVKRNLFTRHQFAGQFVNIAKSTKMRLNPERFATRVLVEGLGAATTAQIERHFATHLRANGITVSGDQVSTQDVIAYLAFPDQQQAHDFCQIQHLSPTGDSLRVRRLGVIYERDGSFVDYGADDDLSEHYTKHANEKVVEDINTPRDPTEEGMVSSAVAASGNEQSGTSSSFVLQKKSSTKFIVRRQGDGTDRF